MLTPPPRRQAATSPSRASLNDGKDGTRTQPQTASSSSPMAAASAKFNGYLHSSTNNRDQPTSNTPSGTNAAASSNTPPTARAYAKRPPPVPSNDSFSLYPTLKSSNRSSSSSQLRPLPATPSPSVSSISSFETEARPEPPPKDAARRAPTIQNSLSATHLPLLTLDTHKPTEPITSFAEAVEATMSRYRSGSTSSVPSVSSRARSDSSQSQNHENERSLGRSLPHGSVSSISSYTSMSSTAADHSSSSPLGHRSRHHDQYHSHHHQPSSHNSSHHSQSARSSHGSSAHGYNQGQHPSSPQSSNSPPISPYYDDQPQTFSSAYGSSNGYNTSQSNLHYQQQQQQPNGHYHHRQQQPSSGRPEVPYRQSQPSSAVSGPGSRSTTSLNNYQSTNTSGVPKRGLKSALVKTPIARARAKEAGPPRKVFWGDMMTIVTIERPETPPPPPPPDKKKKKKKVKKGGNPTGVNQDPEYDSDYYNQPYTPLPAEVVMTLAPWIGNPNFDEEQANSRYLYEDYDDYDDEYDEYDDDGGAYHHPHDLRMGPDDYDDDDDDDEDEDEDEDEEGGSVVWGKGIGGGKGFQKKKSGGMFKFKRAVNRLLRN
ncbi:hypothetical protein BGW42_004751 [Actinomortierella wolfii]|nr:hypothetical protein BGW42_004751 [Actinomortierella wolfii]